MTERLLCDIQTAGEVAVKVVVTDSRDRFKRAKRELNLFRTFHKHKRISDVVNGTAVDAAHGVLATCVCVFPFFELGTVQKMLDTGNTKFTKRVDENAPACLRFDHTVAMAKDVLEGLECMHQMHVVHRDIKPGNICVEMNASTKEIRYTIIDLGAAVSFKIRTSRFLILTLTLTLTLNLNLNP